MRHSMKVFVALLVALLPVGATAHAGNAPNLSGHWIPTDAVRAARLFDVGLLDVGPQGFTIAQEEGRITLTREGTFALLPHATSYTLGTDVARWNGETLVLVTTFANGVARASYSLDNDTLRVETTATTSQGATNQFVQTYRRDN
jgi:hypothetical protein